MACAATMAVWWPMLTLWLGPVVWGPAHIAADLRYLVLRRGLSRGSQAVVWGGCLAFVVLTLSGPALGGAKVRLEMVVIAAWLIAGATAGAYEGRRGGRATAAIGAAAALGLAGILWPSRAQMIWVHGHNLLALCILGVFLRRRGRPVWRPLACVLAVALFCAGGYVAGATLAAPGARTFEMHVLEAAACLAPGLPVRYGVGLTSAFAFLQSVHYFVWLWAIPQQDLPGRGTLSFAQSAVQARRDFGGLASVAWVVGACLLMAVACFGVRRAASGYLGLVAFHGYMEAALLAIFFARGRF